MAHNINTAVSEWDNRGITIHDQSNTYKIIATISAQLDRVDEQIDAIYNSNKIRHAEDENLEKMGELLNVRRQSDLSQEEVDAGYGGVQYGTSVYGTPTSEEWVVDNDDVFRKRIILAFRLISMEGTYSEFWEFMVVLLETENFTLSYDRENFAAEVFVKTDSSVYDENPLTRDQIAEAASSTVPAGHRVTMQEEGTFEITDDDTIAASGHDADKGLTADDIETGGTLSTDI